MRLGQPKGGAPRERGKGAAARPTLVQTMVWSPPQGCADVRWLGCREGSGIPLKSSGVSACKDTPGGSGMGGVGWAPVLSLELQGPSQSWVVLTRDHVLESEAVSCSPQPHCRARGSPVI